MFAEIEAAPEISAEDVRLISESLGISSISDQALKDLASDMTFRLKQMIQDSKKFMENGRRQRLTCSDFDRALKIRGMEAKKFSIYF